MKIITLGKDLSIMTITCNKCGCILSINKNDVYKKYLFFGKKYVNCPMDACRNKIYI